MINRFMYFACHFPVDAFQVQRQKNRSSGYSRPCSGVLVTTTYVGFWYLCKINNYYIIYISNEE